MYVKKIKTNPFTSLKHWTVHMVYLSVFNEYGNIKSVFQIFSRSQQDCPE